MKKAKPILYRRKRAGRTNYYKRLKLLSSHLPRIVIRLSLNRVNIQLVEFKTDGDKIVVGTNSSELKKLGWNFSYSNMPASYLTGLLFGIKIKENTKKIIVDIGFNTSIKGSKVYAVIKGIIDAGVKINCSGDILPEEKRINGSHISEYAKSLKQNDEDYKKQFSKYIKNNINPEDITKTFEEVKNKIMSTKK
jgi:large subunit ribosomal protein L18